MSGSLLYAGPLEAVLPAAAPGQALRPVGVGEVDSPAPGHRERRHNLAWEDGKC